LFVITVHVNDLLFITRKHEGPTSQEKKKKSKIVLRYKCRLDFIRKIVGKSLEIREGNHGGLRIFNANRSVE
jgi:hypothetical protein